MKIVESLEESDLLIESTSEINKNEGKEQKGGFLGRLLATLGASILGNILTGKGRIKTGKGSIRSIFNTTPSLNKFKKFN